MTPPLADTLGLGNGASSGLRAPRAAQPAPPGAAGVRISSVAGGVPRSGGGVYTATKHAVGAFGESLRQEVTGRHVRVSLIEPGAVATELAGHNRPEILESIRGRFSGVERMESE